MPNYPLQTFQPVFMQLVVSLDAVDLRDGGLDLPPMVLDVLLGLLDLDPLLLDRAVSILEPCEGYDGDFLKGLGRVLECCLYP